VRNLNAAFKDFLGKRAELKELERSADRDAQAPRRPRRRVKK
jgi:hypothetical protein